MQPASTPQKQLSISITKIFNWPQTDATCSFDLNFYPQDSDTPIIQKSVNGVFLSNSMNLNSLLKITYTDEEKIVIMRLLRSRKEKKELLGEFQIDLDALREKNVQYFPFGKDHVLQINLYTPMRANSRSSRAQEYSYYNQNQPRNSRLNSDHKIYGLGRGTHDKLIPQRKRIPSRHEPSQRNRYYGEANAGGYQMPYESRIKKSFSEKVFSLLQEVKSMKQDIIASGSKDKEVRPGTKNNEQRVYSDPENAYLTRTKKSMSDGKFKSYGAISGVGTTGYRREQQASSGAAKGQKHRLILSTLNVVPCEQYYNKNEQKASQSPPPPQNQLYRQHKQQNCRVSSKYREREPAYQHQHQHNDYYYQSRFN